MPADGHVNVAMQVFRIGQLVGDALDAALEPVGLDGVQFAVLSVLRKHQPIRPADLAEVLSMPTSSLSRLLERFESEKLVRRRADKAESRGRLVLLTAEGDRRVRACYPLFHEFVTTVESRLGRRLGPVQDALADLQSALEEQAAERGPARASS